MGIDENLYDIAEDYINEDDDVFLVYISKNSIMPYSKKDKKTNMKQLFKEKSISPYPEEIEKENLSMLKELKKALSEKEINMV